MRLGLVKLGKEEARERVNQPPKGDGKERGWDHALLSPIPLLLMR